MISPDSFVHDGQRYTAAGFVERRYAVWSSHCLECGEPFEFTAWFDDADAKPASPTRRCKACLAVKKNQRLIKDQKEADKKTARAIQRALDAQHPVSGGEWTKADQDQFERLGARRRKARPRRTTRQLKNIL